MKSTMFDDSDFCTNNLVYPVITPRAPPVECPKPTEDLTKSKTILMDHILNSNKMQCVRQSKKEEGLVKRDEIMMNRKMKRSIPGLSNCFSNTFAFQELLSQFVQSCSPAYSSNNLFIKV